MRNLKKVFNLIAVAIIAITLTNCNSKIKNDSETKSTSNESEISLKTWDNSQKVNGDADKYIEIIDKQISIKKSENSEDWGTKIKFKVLQKTDKWLGDMEVTFLDEKGNQLYEFESTMTNDALTRNSLSEKINEGTGFYEVDFSNSISSTILNSQKEADEKVKKFNENISKAKYFKVSAKMENNPNK